ncbi:MAG: hypothetical protein HQ481_04510 [Alphaproteobacteria bacterium]|nr:hypothetical protein [Alphaproteobacteria bacterium]
MIDEWAERILVAGGAPENARYVEAVNQRLGKGAVIWVGTSAEAVEVLSDPNHRFSLALVDRALAPEPAYDVFRFVRRNPISPYPGLAVGMIGDVITDNDVNRAAVAGCVLMMRRPFDPNILLQAVNRWPMDRTDFLVTGAYVGPDRRRLARFEAIDRRQLEFAVEQSIASTAPDYDIVSETTMFRFKRFPVRNKALPPPLALRNGLRRVSVVPAVAHIGVKKKEALGLLGTQAGAMSDALRRLQATLEPGPLKRLNGQAAQATRLSAQRGLLLMAAVTRSLAQYSGGGYRIGERLVGFLRAHLDGVDAALRHRIIDDGGPVGREIMATLKAAERRFADPGNEGAGLSQAVGD